jgi:tripartite-type tricarboxylate transporter receptor subunit TctC
VVGSAGMPPAVVKQLVESLNQVLKSPDLKEKLSTEAVKPQTMTPEQFAASIKADVVRWTTLAKARRLS